MDPHLDDALASIKALIAAIDRKSEENDAREHALREAFSIQIAKIEEARADLKRSRLAAETTALNLRTEFVGSHPKEPEPTFPFAIDSTAVPFPQQKRRARIGPQRYGMFSALRERGPLSADRIAIITTLDVRRIKHQMSEDVRDGYVDQASDDTFILTDSGRDLMSRFEAHRLAVGKPLPSLGDADGEEREDGDADIPTKEAPHDVAKEA